MLMKVEDERSKYFGLTGFLFDVDVAGDFWLRFDNNEDDCFDPKSLIAVD